MPMGSVATLPNSAIAVGYMKKFMDWSIKTGEVFGPLVAWEAPIPEDGGGAQSFNFPAYGEVPPTSTPLPEMSDVTPEGIFDFNYTVTPYEYGRAFAVSQLARYQSRTTLQDKLARIAAQDRVNSIDRLIRRKVYGHGSDVPTNTYLNSANSTMATMVSTDVISWDFLTELVLQAKSLGIEPMDGSNFVAVIHPLLEKGIKNMADYKNVGQYNVPDIFYKGEVGMVAGIRFIVSPQAKVFWGAGPATALAGSTTLTNAYNAGSTTIVIGSGANIANGDYLTIGTVETESVSPSANLEQVRVVSGGGTTTLVIRGLGTYKPDSNQKTSGLYFDHAAGEAVVEKYNVCGIPILGKNSLIGVHGARTGRYGQSGFKTGLDILDRFGYVWWYWYGGVSRVDRYMLLGKTVVTSWTLGSN